jgi:hypothetical protein
MATRLVRGGPILRLAATLVGCLLGGATAHAQVAGTNAEVAGCRTCHISADSEGAKSFITDFKSHEFIRLNESKTWFENDPHIRAYEQIMPEKNPVARKMQEFLAGDNPSYKVTEDYRCLTCHSTDTNPTSKGKRELREFVRRDTLGVGCNTCHGVKNEWQAAHYGGEAVEEGNVRYLKWRTEKPDVKEKSGMKNLRDPHVKADLCASCHVGNPDENKVVTHEIYAAGHPPLPPLELVTFMEDEPRHWGYPSELKFLTDYAKKNPAQAWEVFRFKPAEQDNYLARHMAAGALASLKAEMKLLEAEANRAAKDGDGLDYARYDCYSCHHDLKYPSARQERGYGDRVPGRPPLKAWTAALPGTVIAHAGTLDDNLKGLSGQFPDAWRTISRAATASPFAYGKGSDVAKAASALAAWTVSFNDAIDKANYSAAATDKLVADIATAATAPAWYGDTEATMHLAWAYRSLQLARKRDVSAFDKAMRDVIPIGVRNQAVVADILKANPDWKGPVPVGKVLPGRQLLFANFDPKKFNVEFAKLRE